MQEGCADRRDHEIHLHLLYLSETVANLHVIESVPGLIRNCTLPQGM